MRRASQPEEIAEVISFLAGPRASYITGATVAADGGTPSDLAAALTTGDAFHHADDSAHAGISLSPRTNLPEEVIICTS